MLSQLSLSQLGPDLRECIEKCQDCHTVCESTVMECLQKGGPHAEPEHLKILLDCADACQTSADFMLRGSRMHFLTCGICAEVCLACADSCDKFGPDTQMQDCASMCRQCADSCRKMASQTPRAA